MVENVRRAFRVAQGPTVCIIKAPCVPYLLLDIHFFFYYNEFSQYVDGLPFSPLFAALRENVRL